MDCKVYGITREVLLRDIEDVDDIVRPLHSLLSSFANTIADGYDGLQLFPLRYQDHLIYHYLGGTIMALLGETTRAIEMLEIVSLNQFGLNLC